VRTLLGIGVIVGSGLVVYGGITGRLAPMLAALFDPSSLVKAPGTDGLGIAPITATTGAKVTPLSGSSLITHELGIHLP
jgi:hypothetical protein